MKVRFSRRAIREIKEIADHLRPLNPTAAAKVGSAIEATVRRIAEHPLSGRMQIDGSRKAVVSRYGYLLFYDVRSGSVEITTVQHPARGRPTSDV